MAGCTPRSRRKQMRKWERESTFRANSEELSFDWCACSFTTIYPILLRENFLKAVMQIEFDLRLFVDKGLSCEGKLIFEVLQ